MGLARQLGDRDALDAAESSIVNALCGLGRYAEAERRGQAMLARVDADGSGRNANLPWLIGALLAALIASGRLEQARSLLPRAFAAGHRFNTPSIWPQFCALAVAEQRYPVAAQLLGYTRQCHEARVGEVLGPEQLQTWMQYGATLDEAAAEALLEATSQRP